MPLQANNMQVRGEKMEEKTEKNIMEIHRIHHGELTFELMLVEWVGYCLLIDHNH